MNKIDTSLLALLPLPVRTDEEREAQLRKMLAVPSQLERQTQRLIDSLTPRERKVLEDRMGIKQ